MTAASNTKDAHTARSVLAKTNQMDGRITTAFQPAHVVDLLQ